MPQKRLIRSTTVLSVRRNGSVVLAGDGQVTLGEGVYQTQRTQNPAFVSGQDPGRVSRLNG
jgi:ATP-dependent protease HslVU (ClpYQ) peptidase subunit